MGKTFIFPAKKLKGDIGVNSRPAFYEYTREKGESGIDWSHSSKIECEGKMFLLNDKIFHAAELVTDVWQVVSIQRIRCHRVSKCSEWSAVVTTTASGRNAALPTGRTASERLRRTCFAFYCFMGVKHSMKFILIFLMLYLPVRQGVLLP